MLDIIELCSLLVVFLCGLLYFNRQSSFQIHFFAIVCFWTINKVLILEFSDLLSLSPGFLFNLNESIEYIALIGLILTFITQPFLKVFLGIVGLIPVCMYAGFFWNPIAFFPDYISFFTIGIITQSFQSVSCFIIFILSCYHLVQMAVDTSYFRPVYLEPQFWIFAGSMFYYSFELYTQGLSSLFRQNATGILFEQLTLIYFVKSGIGIFSNLLFAISFICYRIAK